MDHLTLGGIPLLDFDEDDYDETFNDIEERIAGLLHDRYHLTEADAVVASREIVSLVVSGIVPDADEFLY